MMIQSDNGKIWMKLLPVGTFVLLVAILVVLLLNMKFGFGGKGSGAGSGEGKTTQATPDITATVSKPKQAQARALYQFIVTNKDQIFFRSNPKDSKNFKDFENNSKLMNWEGIDQLLQEAKNSEIPIEIVLDEGNAEDQMEMELKKRESKFGGFRWYRKDTLE